MRGIFIFMLHYRVRLAKKKSITNRRFHICLVRFQYSKRCRVFLCFSVSAKTYIWKMTIQSAFLYSVPRCCLIRCFINFRTKKMYAFLWLQPMDMPKKTQKMTHTRRNLLYNFRCLPILWCVIQDIAQNHNKSF